MSVARSEGMPGSLHGTEVIARSDDYRIDAIVNTLVVRGGTVGVDMGDVDGFLEFLGVFGSCEMLVNAVQLFHGAFHPDLHAAVGCVVRQDGHNDFYLAEVFGQVFLFGKEVLQAVPKLFQSGIDEVGTHRVSCVELHANLVIVRDLCAVVDKLHPEDAAAAFPHLFGHGIGVGQEAFLDFREQGKQLFLVATPTEMHLSDLAHIHDLGMESASFTPEFGRR